MERGDTFSVPGSDAAPLFDFGEGVFDEVA